MTNAAITCGRVRTPAIFSWKSAPQKYRRATATPTSFDLKFWVLDRDLPFQESVEILETGGKILWNTLSRNGRYSDVDIFR